ncbi:MAG: TolC family protein [Planctomycetota bacterium]|jgi:outer membrane protein TolC|nr:TolC family protein [Planctomycetota bacterium]
MLLILPLGLSLLSVPAQAVASLAQEPATAASQPAMLELKLSDVVRMAHDKAPALAQARLQALAAEGSVMEAEGFFDPVLFADLTYLFSEQPGSGFFSAFGNTKTRGFSAAQGIRSQLVTGGNISLKLSESYNDTSYLPDSQSDTSVVLEFTQPLMRGAWNLSATQARRQAEYARDRDLAGVRQAGSDVVQAAVDAYWDLAFAYADLRVKEQSLALAVGLRDLTEAKFQVGAVAEVEVVQTEADIASRTDALLTARNTVHRAEDALRILLFSMQDDRDWQVRLRPSDAPPAVNVEVVDWRDAFAIAREFRADLRQLRMDIDKAQLDWDVAQEATMPKLDFVGTGSFFAQDSQVGNALDALYDHEFPGYTLGLVFEIPLGNNQFAGAENRTRQMQMLARRILRDRENEVANEVRDAVRNLNYNAERVTVTATASSVAARQLEAEQRRLAEGASTNFQVLQFQTDLAVAQSQEVQAKMEYAKAITKLNTVRGLNWDATRPDLADLDDYRPGQRYE